MTTDAYAKRVMVQNPIEAKILKKIYKALRDAHDPITSVNADDCTPVETWPEVYRQVFNLDEAFLETASGGWVRFINGERWECLNNYTLNLEEALSKVNAYIQKYLE